MLLQMRFLEQLYRHCLATNFKSDWTNYILSHPDRIKELVDKLPRDREAEIKARIKHVQLEVERNYRSTLDVLSNDRKNAKEELAQRDAIFEVRVRKHCSTILTLQEDLDIVTCAMEQQEEDYKKEKNCYDNMNEAKDRVLQLRDALNDVYAGYLHHIDERSKGKKKMAYKDGNESDNDEVRNQMISQETVSIEEVRALRQQMAEMYEAWTSGQDSSSLIRDYLNTNMSPSIQVSTNDLIYPPGFGPYTNTSNIVGTFTVCPLSTPMMSNPLFMPTAPTNSIPQPTMVPKSNNDPPSKVRHDHGYTLEEAIKIPRSYPHIHQYSSPIEVEKMVKNKEHKEMAKKMKSLEKNIRDMQGLGGHKGISFSDLCMFPHVHFLAGFKTPKFEKYNGHGDPVAHLKRYCNQLRGAGSNEELFMAYFGESLMEIASEWFIDQDTSNWHSWDDLARCFVQKF
ncbi:hypothetical protein H5410_030494 [Solanum commersonii]|uniref:Uncharacterized protein n=1 Tax=Solanum commersonii TaxID=4109 RepID=A0A9J5YIU7_SOLCO|nr:hypothetical protein H5410_030494 [Solanum commersonii]